MRYPKFLVRNFVKAALLEQLAGGARRAARQFRDFCLELRYQCERIGVVVVKQVVLLSTYPLCPSHTKC